MELLTELPTQLPLQRQDAPAPKSLLRFITCGSVDDGKSTLIGRLLYDSKTLLQDQLDAVAQDSRKWGTQGEAIDFALLVDGLAAEREQGITIDVAYRYFATARRKFIVADTPGHEQYTRNMVTGASGADLAVILVDARKGVLEQTRRHSCLVQLIGIRQVVLAINKMDLVGHDEEVFARIAAEYRAFAARIGLAQVTSIPISALSGANMTEPSAAMPWYQGPALLPLLEDCEVDETRLQAKPLRLPIQWVNRPNLDFRGYCGQLASGVLQPGQRVRILPSGRSTRVARLVGLHGDAPLALAGESVTITLEDEVDVSRGDILCAEDSPAEVADQFECTLVWMAEEPMLPGRPYLVKLGTRTVGATVTEPKYKLNVNTLEHLAAKQLELNEIGVCKLALDRAVPFDAYAENRTTGGFIVIDRMTNNTVGAGMLHFALRRAHNIHPQHLDVDQAARSAIKGQQPVVLWFTGLSGAGKSTIANLVEKKLLAQGRHSYLLDGDNLRHGLSDDLGFSAGDRAENVRRVGHLTRLLADAGVVALASLVSPLKSDREVARTLNEAAKLPFLEVYVATPLAECERRDPKGLYARARAGELRGLTGVDAPYEPPEDADLVLDTAGADIDALVAQVLDVLATARS